MKLSSQGPCYLGSAPAPPDRASEVIARSEVERFSPTSVAAMGAVTARCAGSTEMP